MTPSSHNPRQLCGENSCEQTAKKTQPVIRHEVEGSAHGADLDAD